MHTRYTYILKFVLPFSDLLILNGTFWVAGEFAYRYYYADAGTLYRIYLPVANLLWLLSAGFFRLYLAQTLDHLETIYRATWRSVALHVALFSAYLLFTRGQGIDASVFLVGFYLGLGAGLLASRLVGTYLQGVLLTRFRLRRSVAIISHTDGGRRLASYFKAHERRYQFEGYLTENDIPLLTDDGKVTTTARQQFKRAAMQHVQEVYVSLPSHQVPRAAALVEEGERHCLRVKLVPDFTRHDDVPYAVSILGHMPVISIRHEPMHDVGERLKKRVFDIAFSALVVLLVMSWLYPLLALLIKLESRGPVLFKQQRSGRDNQPFWCYKFRSMRVNGDSDNRQATRGDRRITRVGAFLRRTSLDELPQFFNVLQGHMSVVGPRPHMLKHTEEYRAVIDRYMTRQFLKPGITGWAQVNGYRGETTDPRLMERRVAHDIWYLENWTAMLDVRIVFMTVINMVVGEDNAH